MTENPELATMLAEFRARAVTYEQTRPAVIRGVRCDWITVAGEHCRSTAQRGFTRCALHRQTVDDAAPGYFHDDTPAPGFTYRCCGRSNPPDADPTSLCPHWGWRWGTHYADGTRRT